MSRRWRSSLLVLTTLLVVGATACEPVARRDASGSVRQVWVTGLDPSDTVQLFGSETAVTPIQTGIADARGAYVFHDVPAPGDYWVYAAGSAKYDPRVKVIGVTTETQQPSSSDYDDWISSPGPAERPLVSTVVMPAVLEGPSDSPALGFVPVRDSTALTVTAAVPEGTCLTAEQTGCARRPTVVMYTPYSPLADPAGASALAHAWVGAGYAFVTVDLRGTACSGGAYDGSGRLVGTDGYDVVEILGRQAWSTGSVALYGFSAIGLAAVPVAGLRPPHLAAIAIGGIGDPYSAVKLGGMAPFGVSDPMEADGLFDWGVDTDDGQLPGEPPLPAGTFRSYSWEIVRAVGLYTEPFPGDVGDIEDLLDWPGASPAHLSDFADTCHENQQLHGQRSFLRTAGGQAQEVDGETLDRLRAAVRQPGGGDMVFPQYHGYDLTSAVEAPVMVTGASRDNAIPGASDMAGAFPNASTTWAVLSNGYHDDLAGTTHEGIAMLEQFMRLYVARMPATWNRSDEATLYGAPEPAGVTTEREAAEAQPVAVIWGRGENIDFATEPVPASNPVVTRHAAVPGGAVDPPGFGSARLYASNDGRLDYVMPPGNGGLVSYVEDPSSRDRLGPAIGNDAIAWSQHEVGSSVRFETSEALGNAGFWVAGPMSADLWVRSSTTDADLQVSLSEVRSDGSEVLLQTGYRRASRRQADIRSTPLRPLYTDSSVELLSPNTWTEVRVALPTTMAPVQPGSRLRLTVSAPGGDLENRVFDEDSSAVIEIGTSAAHPSSVNLPFMGVLPTNDTGATSLAELYGDLLTYRAAEGIGCDLSGGHFRDARGNPCRAYEPHDLAPTGVSVLAIPGGVRVSWSAPSAGSPLGYAVYVAPSGSNAVDTVPTVVGGGTTTVDVPTSPGLDYVVRVAGHDGTKLGPLSVDVEGTAGY